MKYAYYPGCSLESTATEYDLSVRAVCSDLGIELVELSDWSCCGASAGHSTNHRLASALVGRNLALAESEKLDIAVACPACYLRFRTTYQEVKDDSKKQRELVNFIGMPYEAKYRIRHLLDVICNDIGLDRVNERLTKPLGGLKVVAYYGCYLVRPPKVVAFDDPENPQSMDKLLTTLGAEVRDWSGKVDCCGGSLSLSKRTIASQLVRDIRDMAQKAGAEAIVTACPLCHSNLETRQTGSETIVTARPLCHSNLETRQTAARQGKLPIFYFTELMGLAMGIPGARSWLKKHLISPLNLLASHGL